MTDVGISADLHNQTAVIFGGTQGIGRAIAETLHNAGADVVPTSRTETSVRDAAESVDCDLVHPADVTDREDVRSLLERTVDQIGPINILINSAGVVQDAKPVADIGDDDWNVVLDTNLYGVFLTSQLIPEYMPDEGNRNIVNVSSMSSKQPIKGMTAYTASKFGVTGLTQNFALDYADRNIRVNAIAPGYVRTSQTEDVLDDPDTRDAIHRRTPLSRYADVEDIAASALFLASPAASFVTGEILLVDGGFTLK